MTATYDPNVLIAHVESSLELAEAERSGVSPAVLSLEGMSGRKTRHFYNALCSLPGARYLEIGTWRGSTFCSALDGNVLEAAIAVDNWSEFGGPRDAFLENLGRFKGHTDARFVEGDCFDEATVARVAAACPSYNLYLFDGEHTREAQYRALRVYAPLMNSTFIFVVDDWNWQSVRVLG
jgi:hypothetical protein